ncbi:MAG: hypothetical protein NZ551_07530 [Microscillaceae bacterium]|nr:hypothetical protein [Microscillaceae bacterium]MDW8461046.1 hypothetical protein [Cytophagales bacterium]
MYKYLERKSAHFKLYPSGNVRWFLVGNDYAYFQEIFAKICFEWDIYHKYPLQIAICRQVFARCFSNVMVPPSVKLSHAEAIAMVWLFEQIEATVLSYELQNLLRI